MSFDGLFDDDALAPPPLLGDFYREPEDVTRGITLSAFDCNSIGDVWSPTLSGPWEPLKLIEAPRSVQTRACRFQDFEEGRKVPEDPFFVLEKTTQYLLGVSPSKAGNLLLDLLEQEIPSSITKINEKKFTIKANAFHDGNACQIKICIYQQEPGCAVEFQRRSGDALAFWGVYEKAKQYLCEHTASHGLQRNLAISKSATKGFPTTVDDLSPMGLDVQRMPADFFGEAANEDYLTVLLQMPRQAPHLQDEIASSILGMVQDENLQNLAAWCKPEAFEVLLELLASDRFVAVYPVACLLVRLADLPEARSQFLNQGLSKFVLPRLWVQATGATVWLQLADLVHSVVSKDAAHMTGKERQETAAAIAAAIELEPLESDPIASQRAVCVGQRLREALHLLGSDTYL